MCILITKKKGVKFPSVDKIVNSARSNPDGFALAWNEGGKVMTYKTMSARCFVERYRKLAATLDTDTTAMVIHARIATHGVLGLKNCHCWKSFVGTDNEMAFAHNGILSIGNRDGMTDSETFLRDYFEPVFNAQGWEGADDVIREMIGGSKFAFIDGNGDIRQYGGFVDVDGCQFSNYSFMPRLRWCS